MVGRLYELAEIMTDEAASFELGTTIKTSEIESLETFWLHHVARGKDLNCKLQLSQQIQESWYIMLSP